jgi:MFS family permease
MVQKEDDLELRSSMVPPAPVAGSFGPGPLTIEGTSDGIPLKTGPTKQRPQLSAGNFSHAWRALTHRNFRLFFGGQSISLIGTWMTRIATSWLVYRLTGSAMLLGLVGFAGQIPTFLLAPFAGVWVDRLNRQQVLVITQVLAMLQSFGLAVLTLTKVINIPEILALSALQGLINAFDMPGRQAFMVQMVEDRQDLGNAIAINSSMVNMARLVGPSLAGIVIAAVGEGYCFLIDGVSYLAVIGSLLAMKLPVAQPRGDTPSMLEQLREGWAYVWDFAPVRNILLLFAIVSVMTMPYTVLMPIFAGSILKGGPHTLGFLMAAVGIGALISGLSLVLRKSVVGLLRMIPTAVALFGVGLILFAMSRVLWISIVLMLLAGFGMMQQMTASNTIIQTIVAEDKRGRVMSYYTMAFVGMAPFGSLFAGLLAGALGAPLTVAISGIFCIAAALWFTTRLKYIRTLMRPIYVDLGILPAEVSSVLEDAGGN